MTGKLELVERVEAAVVVPYQDEKVDEVSTVKDFTSLEEVMPATSALEIEEAEELEKDDGTGLDGICAAGFDGTC